MRLGAGFYEVVEAGSRGKAVDLDGELDRRGVSDPRLRTLAWDLCQAAQMTQLICDGKSGSSAYVMYDHRLRRHIARFFDAQSDEARALTQRADALLSRAVRSVKKPVLVPIPRRATRADEEDTLVGTAA